MTDAKIITDNLHVFFHDNKGGLSVQLLVNPDTLNAYTVWLDDRAWQGLAEYFWNMRPPIDINKENMTDKCHVLFEGLHSLGFLEGGMHEYQNDDYSSKIHFEKIKAALLVKGG